MSAPAITHPTICPACRQPNQARARFCQHCGHDVILNNAGPRYFLTRAIKAGGQGAVYEARGEDGRVYAVKEMLDNLSDPAERAAAVARFDAEAELLRRLNDPRIPRVYAAFHDEGRHYLVMDFIRGQDLDELVAREGPQPEARVLAWADAICDVLGQLHAQGIVYRDMKPGNLMLDDGGQLKLIDFGIAKLLQANVRGTQIGTPGYAPPEQYQGLAAPASDIYALGATLHHLLTGRDPQQHQPFVFPPLRALVPAISPRTEAAVARALEMRPEDRFQAMADFRAALRPGGAVVARAPAAAAPAAQAAPPPTAQAAPPPAPQAAPPPTVPAAPGPVPAPQQQPAAPAPQAGPPVKPAARGRLRGLWALLALLVLAAGGAALAFGLLGPGAGPLAPTVTPQVLVARPFTAREIEVQLPATSDDGAVSRAFAEAFLALARLDCGCEPQIQPGTLVYLTGGEPRRAAIGPGGATYRASMEATILVPQ